MKVLLSGAGERMRPLLALPTFERFAATYGYRLQVAQLDDGDGSRAAVAAPDGAKIALLRAAVEDGHALLRLEACRFDRDIASDLSVGSFQGLVLERFPSRVNPNTGVWHLRAEQRSAAFLAAVDEIGLLEHAWTDQAAVCKALGWSLGDYHDHGTRATEPSSFT